MPNTSSQTTETTIDTSVDTMVETTGKAIINDAMAKTWKITVKEEHPVPLVKFEKRIPDTSKLDMSSSPPELVQNQQRFPPVKTIETFSVTDPETNKEKVKKLYKYSYDMNYGEIDLDTDLKMLRRTSNLDNDYRKPTVIRQTTKFNRFRIPVAGDAFSKGFGHVFFTRPSCNILNYDGSRYSLTDTVKDDMTFNYGYKNHLDLLKQLCDQTEFSHDFMLYLTNKAQGFDVSDKTLETSNYGQNLMGHSIQIGRTSEKSKTAGNFSVPYAADRDMYIYALHNYWVKYIAGVFRGRYRPKPTNIIGKVIDYACACFYFVTAEDFETIIYWTKLYGVFPTSTPDGVLSWKSGGPILNPEPSINYAFSWRSEDNDPKVLLDFNNNATYSNSDFKYAKTYEQSRYGLGNTWVEAPFVEFAPNSAFGYTPKLRWRPSDTSL